MFVVGFGRIQNDVVGRWRHDRVEIEIRWIIGWDVRRWRYGRMVIDRRRIGRRIGFETVWFHY